MDSFEERKKAFESQFAHDQHLAFIIRVKRDKHLGLWAAEKMQYDANKAAAYALKLIETDLEVPGDENIIELITQDFEKSGVALDESELKREFSHFYELAKTEVMGE